jgi:hypothetical protein
LDDPLLFAFARGVAARVGFAFDAFAELALGFAFVFPTAGNVASSAWER